MKHIAIFLDFCSQKEVTSVPMNHGLNAYHLIDRFAIGGAAELYRASSKKDGSLVAIKRMRPDIPFDPEISAGFLLEIQLAMLATHPNLVCGLAHGSHDGLEHVVLEYVAGYDLHRFIQQVKKYKVSIPYWMHCFILEKVLSGLYFAHEMKDLTGQKYGLVHRDLNPRNVLLSFQGDIKISDFGAAVPTLQEPTPSEVIGSTGFLSPEQAKLEYIDQRSDLFSLGCVAFELFTKIPAFQLEGASDLKILRTHQKGQIASFPKNFPEDIKLWLLKATSIQKEARFFDAQEMLLALKNLPSARIPEKLPHSTQVTLGFLLQRLFPKSFVNYKKMLIELRKRKFNS